MRGATEEEIDQAVADGVIDLFVADRMLVPSRRRYTRMEVSELTGVSIDKLERFWRALGFPAADDADTVFTDLDLEAVRIYQGLQALGAADVDTSVQLARVMGSSMARIAEAELGTGNLISTRGRPHHLRRRLCQCGGRHHLGRGAAARVRVATAGGGGHPAQHAAAQPRPGPGAEPGDGGRVRRHGRVHPSQPAPHQRGAGGRRAAVRGDLARHRDQRTGAGGQDDRRRGHVRRRQRRRRGPDRARSGRRLRRRRPALRCQGGAGVRSGAPPRRRLLRPHRQPGPSHRQHREPGHGADVRRIPRVAHGGSAGRVHGQAVAAAVAEGLGTCAAVVVRPVR